jgi:hypothetical protein
MDNKFRIINFMLRDFIPEDGYETFNSGVKVFTDSRATVYYIDTGIEVFCRSDMCYHRVGGPAWIGNSDGKLFWFHENRMIHFVQPYCEVCGFDEQTTVFWLLRYGNTLPTCRDQL